jgi:excinuclease ABC subunit B
MLLRAAERPETAALGYANRADRPSYITKLESDMRKAAKKFEFEKTAKLRDTVQDLRTKTFLLR